MFVRMMTALVGAALLTGCAFTPHQVAVTASAPQVESARGDGITLALQVLDDRDSLVVGQRGTGMVGADITAPDVIPTLERELTAGLEAQGFRVVDARAPADAEVKARLRSFKFFIETGFFAGAENTDVVVGIEAESGGDEFERIYRASGEVPAIFVPGGEGIDQKLNAALAYVLSQIMKDQELMTFLARRPAAGL